MTIGIAFASTYGDVSVGSSATLIAPSNPLRKGLMIFNNSSQIIYIGMDNNVTTATGFPILPTCTFATDDFDGVWKGAVWGISTGSSDARYWEFGP